MVAGESFHPSLVIGGAVTEDFFVDRGDADHLGFSPGQAVAKKCTTCSGRDRQLR
jgi:hypothetical protein